MEISMEGLWYYVAKSHMLICLTRQQFPLNLKILFHKFEGKKKPKMYTKLFTEALILKAKYWKQHKCPTTETCWNKSWCIHMQNTIHCRRR